MTKRVSLKNRRFTRLRPFKVTVNLVREYSATITVDARDREEADEKALEAFNDALSDQPLRLPQPWDEHEPYDYDPYIDTAFRCVDCGKNTQGSEYYMVSDELWADAGMEPHGGMLCLRCLECRIGRELAFSDFRARVPSAEAWQRRVAARQAPRAP